MEGGGNEPLLPMWHCETSPDRAAYLQVVDEGDRDGPLLAQHILDRLVGVGSLGPVVERSGDAKAADQRYHSGDDELRSRAF